MGRVVNALPSRFAQIAALLCCGLGLTICAQYRIDTWTTDNGLPQNSVTGLARTPDQYLWFTTNDGLVRFDGNRFTVFNKSNTPEITSNRLASAFADKSGRLWVQCEDGGIIYYKDGAFHVAAKPDELPAGTRSRFFDYGTNGVIVNIQRKPFHFSNGRFTPLVIPGLADNIPVILGYRDGGLLFSGKDVVYIYRDGSLKAHSIAGFFNGTDYEIAYEDRDGGVWIGYFLTDGDKRSLLRIKNGKVDFVPDLPKPVNQFVEDDQGNLWLALYTEGVYRIDRAAVASDQIPADALKPMIEIDGLSTNASGHMIFDHEGGLWVGAEKGLSRISAQIVKVFGKSSGLKEENVYPVLADRRGRIWAGVWPNNLVRYEDGAFKTSVTDETVFITSIFEDSTDRIWFGTLGELYYLENDKPVQFSRQTGFADGTEFSVITETSDGTLWFGTNRGLGRYRDGQATILTVKDGLPSDYVVAILTARDGKLWIGTRGGLASVENETVRSFTVADGLASNSIRSLYEDADGVLWIGTYDAGLARLKDGAFTRYGVREGLSSNGAFCILEDRSGWFWINSNQGIYRVNRHELNEFAEGKIRSLNSIAYGKEDGLVNIEGNGGRQPAAAKGSDGRFWFPTAQGLAVIDPETVPINRVAPPVLIEQVMIDRIPVSNDEFQNAVNQRTKITLSPGQNNFEFNYTALSFVNSQHLKFKYKLENLESDWHEVGTRRTAYYSYLPPGDYVFRVIAANRDGVWNEEGARVAITVLPPFYRTWWFLLLLAVSVAAVIVFAYYLRIRQLKLGAARQEEFARQLIASQERDRGRIAAEMHDGLGQSLAIIKNRAVISLTKSEDQHYTLEQMREIADASSDALEEVQGIIYNLRPIHLDRLGLTGAIEDMAERMAQSSGLELSTEVDNIDDIYSKQSENSIYRIVQECLNNVVKHSRARSVALVVKKERGAVRIAIKDDGMGFDPEKPRSGHEKGGFGLNGMSERAKLLGGQTVIESSPGAGTRISVSIPRASTGTDEAKI